MDDVNVNLNFDDEKKISLDENILNMDSNIDIVNNEMLGVELLANKNKSGTVDTPNTPQSGGYSSGEESFKQNNKEDYDFFKEKDEKENGNKKEGPSPQVRNVPLDDPIINDQRAVDDNEFKAIHTMSSQEIKNEKIDLIYKFKKLENQGVRTTMNYNMNSHLEDMRNEYLKLKKQREVDNSIKFQRKVMMAAITGLEFLNNKFDPFSIKLDGWSESINENITDYDEVFEELSEKYGGKAEMAPEIKLLMMVGGSAFMFHLTNTMFKSSIPGMDDILKQNPDLMNQFAKAAVGSIGKSNDQAFSTPPMKNMPKEPSNEPPPEPRQEMNGPSGLDDLIHQMNIQPDGIPDLDNISLMSGDTDRKSNVSGITLNI